MPSPANIRVFGASSAVGRRLLPLLCASGRALSASSRQPPGDADGQIRWMRESLADAAALDADTTHVLSLGPLDLFVHWLARQRPMPALRQVLAFGSTSVLTKSASPNLAERALAQRLRDAEATLQRECARLGAAWTLLRPTLIYGGDHDLVARIGQLAARWHVHPGPLGRAGRALRQPVHAGDLAAAVAAAIDNPAAQDRSFDLGGGEVLALAALCRRAARARTRFSLSLPLPVPLLLRLADLLRQLPPGARLSAASAARMGQDQLCDNAPAKAALGYSPRAFEPGLA